jgi:hypothetical protein
MVSVFDSLKEHFTKHLINMINRGVDVDYKELSALLDEPSIKFDLNDEKRSEFTTNLIYAAISDRLTFEQFHSICARLKQKLVFEITPLDFSKYFNKECEWDNAPKLLQLILCSNLSRREEINLLKYIPRIMKETYGLREDYEKKFYSEVSKLADKDKNVLTLLYNAREYIIENDIDEYYAAICRHEFESCYSKNALVISGLYQIGNVILRPARGSKCSDLLVMTVRSIIEGISRAEYDAVIKTMYEITDNSKIKSTLNIIEMVSNDIAALSLEAERINTCVRDARMTISSIKD